MKSTLEWKDTEVDGVPRPGVIVLACCEGIRNYVLARIVFLDTKINDYQRYHWEVQEFNINKFSFHVFKEAIKLWAYLPHRESSDYDANVKQVFQIRYKDKGHWLDIPHSEITNHRDALHDMELLKRTIAFGDVEMMITSKYVFVSKEHIDFYKDYPK